MQKLIAANWKMFKTIGEAREMASDLVRRVGEIPADREVLVIPPSTAIFAVAEEFGHAKGFQVGGQNFHPEVEGAFTGEIAPRMLTDLCCTYALAGHSERRHVFGEGDELVGRKVTFGLENGLKMILCVGEKIDERKGGRVEEVLRRQLEVGLAGVSRDIPETDIVVAYEPVWAIGTGEVAGPEEIVHAHAFIRNVLVELFGEKGHSIRIQYGGSVKPKNCADILALDNVDGVLVGGASLQAESFSQIVKA
ncbi:triose-phosphate isomerase [Desulfobaculum bizertense]|uniref:Triosephosphate isomerase n=1 Tax=Desulfobaculum bizertense DSM 18034 TaxID=1121442 RepID=A0A1T4W440_9BACT|nr:triose-phosphate isomerase [Desulfobaculum bizertense]UIJ38830.1 triose-phosphate isomerase [Desulfobaculum bizertense]SKA71491.1 triosephosphate isomerase [Desulfobaculum bizertense DSM 18034]